VLRYRLGARLSACACSTIISLVTLAFTTLVFLLLRNEEWLTGGIYGISGIKRPVFFGWSTAKPLYFYFFCLGVLAALSLATWWILRSPWGRAFVALRENPIRALSLGVDTRRYTLMAFAMGSSLGGLSGALFAPLVQFLEPASFGLNRSFDLTDGDRRRQRLLLRSLCRRADFGAVAGMDADHRRLLPHYPRAARDGADDVLPVRRHRLLRASRAHDATSNDFPLAEARTP
jgi:hypothetical protein